MPLDLLAQQFRDTKTCIDAITADLRRAAEADETARRLQTMPGIGPITASVLAAALPDVSAFRSARDLPSLARADAETAFERRQGTPWGDLEDGQSIYPTAALPRGHGGDLDPQVYRSRRGLVGAHAGEEAAEGRGHRIGQPHGATGLGNAANRRGLADGLRAGNSGPIAA